MAEIAKNEILLPAGGMDLEATLLCGQSFVWQPAPGGGFAGVAGRRAAVVAQRGSQIHIAQNSPVTVTDAAFWRDYFALDIDYSALEEKFSAHRRLAACVEAGRGVRVLRQPFFDTLLSFIISQNNHITRITGIVSRLREQFGEALPGGGHAFPTPQRLAALCPEDLAPLRAGFRAKYLVDAARKVAGGEVSEMALRAADDETARAMLCRIHGVGVKVADCVLLYSLGRVRVAPMDVWMKRAMATTFPRGWPVAARGFEGIAQQYIFVWARENLGP